MFRKKVWNYYRKEGRDLPWRRTRDPYRILVSEVMLQQTQVERVIPKYDEFLRRFPDFIQLSKASVAEILSVWQGLGYNRRVLNLKRLSGIVVENYSGRLPQDIDLLQQLPGIGEATAGAVAAFAFGLPVPFVETNIRRAFISSFFRSREKVSDAEILKLVEETMDTKNPREWFHALMDYGAMLGRSEVNPNLKSTHYRRQAAFRGSNREFRGKVLRLLLKGPLTKKAIVHGVSGENDRVEKILMLLEGEGFVRKEGRRFRLS
jgi:A/G-specific adenine glycosylase